MSPRRTAADVEAWTRFAMAAEAAAANPARSTVELEKACRAAGGAVFPCEPYTSANPWLAVLNVARRFAGELGVRRSALAGELGRALEAAAAHCPVIAAAMVGAEAAPTSPRPWWSDEK